MEHKRQNSGTLLQGIMGNFKSIIGTSLLLYYMNFKSDRLRVSEREYTGFHCSCNNVLLRKVISTCTVKIKWPLSMRLQDLLLQEMEVLLFQVLASS